MTFTNVILIYFNTIRSIATLIISRWVHLNKYLKLIHSKFYKYQWRKTTSIVIYVSGWPKTPSNVFKPNAINYTARLVLTTSLTRAKKLRKKPNVLSAE